MINIELLYQAFKEIQCKKEFTMSITKDIVVAYQVLKIRQRLLTDTSEARNALSILQLWDIISQSSLIQRDLGNLGIDMGHLKQCRNDLAHCCTFDYNTHLNPILDVLKSDKCAAYLLDFLSEVLDSQLSSKTIMGSYNAIIGPQP